ncbi:HEAT repeat protein [Necator americanus]|uniref:Protein VAC14 homolog n=1 Tax=Necator americanus TaxID=51031 RepID=W2TJH6_NECAM|nr:HEAT repeat protein [Necator americanus]ETN81177.1 HEAT repeat protein [Necator americanus]
MAANGHTRKGGLIGLAAAAIALGKNAPPYTVHLIEPVLSCFNDPDLRVRYYACESLYNIVKICKVAVLSHFDQLFDVLWKLSADTDQNVRSGAELLDRLLMDIVVSKEDFDIANLMSLIRDRIYVQTSSNRKFIVHWLNVMLSTPAFNILPYVSEVSDGLFRMLADGQPAVRDVTETLLGQFLQGIHNNPDSLSHEDRSQMVSVLVAHAHEDEPPLGRKLALIWMDEFIRIYKEKMLPYLSSYLTAVLPSLDCEALKARSVNDYLMTLIGADTKIEEQTVNYVIEVLLKFVVHEKRETRVAVLNWIRHLNATMPSQVFLHMDRIFPVLLGTLSDTSDEVLLLDLHLLSDICHSNAGRYDVDLKSFQLTEDTVNNLSPVSPSLVKFALSLLEMFRAEPALLNDRGVLIIRQLCLLMEPAHIYRALCVLLLREQSITFIQNVVSMLHGVLLTATELFILRDQLRMLEGKDSISLFECVFRCWCHRPIALLGLCLLSQNYAQAAEIAMMLSKVTVLALLKTSSFLSFFCPRHPQLEVDMTLDVLVEIDKLVNMIESPVLAYVRMDLLSACHQRSLSTVLSALLMLMPQSDAFHTLHKRLQAVPALTIIGLVHFLRRSAIRDLAIENHDI